MKHNQRQLQEKNYNNNRDNNEKSQEELVKHISIIHINRLERAFRKSTITLTILNELQQQDDVLYFNTFSDKLKIVLKSLFENSCHKD